MRIGIFDPYLDTLGGGERYMLTIASCLSKNNEVSVFWDSDNPLKEAEKRFEINLSGVDTSGNIFFDKFSFSKRLKASKEFDLIIYLSDGSIPLVLNKLIVHFQFPVEWVDYKNLLSKFKIRRINKIICNSLFTKKYIDKKLHRKSIVLYPPVVSYSSLHNLKKENLILTVGRFEKLKTGGTFKKHEILIEAFKSLIKNGLKNWKLVIVVSHKEADEDEILKIKNNVKEYPIEIVRNATWSVLENLNKRTKIYWHAAGFGEDLEEYPERAEHFGITTVEAMSAGAVPVVIKAGGQMEIVDEKSGFFWNTREELIAETLRLINDENLLKSISKNAIKRSLLFTGDRFCRQVKEIINEK